MSTFREGQSQAHPNKRSTLILALIIVLMANVCIQIWLLYTALNNALANNKDIAFPAFIASAVFFFIGFFWLYYLPGGAGKRKVKPNPTFSDSYQ
jgi:hypothetical protein